MSWSFKTVCCIASEYRFDSFQQNSQEGWRDLFATNQLFLGEELVHSSQIMGSHCIDEQSY